MTLIKDLPETLLEPPTPFNPEATDPDTQLGTGAPATVGTDNLPQGGNGGQARFSSSAFGGASFANFKASDSANVNGVCACF